MPYCCKTEEKIFIYVEVTFIKLYVSINVIKCKIFFVCIRIYVLAHVRIKIHIYRQFILNKHVFPFNMKNNMKKCSLIKLEIYLEFLAYLLIFVYLFHYAKIYKTLYFENFFETTYK